MAIGSETVGAPEMDQLDVALAARPTREALGLTVRAAHREAATEIAGRHGYELRATELRAADVGEAGLLWVELRPLAG